MIVSGLAADEGFAKNMAWLYAGPVMHQRLRPKPHRFTYEIFTLYLDLATLPELSERLPEFAYNAPAPFSFYDADHGPRDGTPLSPWVINQCAKAGIKNEISRIMLLAVPRIFGYVFNPLSVFYCFDAHGNLIALVHEVKNTFGEQHIYVQPIAPSAPSPYRHQVKKAFYVSPFFAVQGQYDFTLSLPQETLALSIRYSDADGDLLLATQHGRRFPLQPHILWQWLFRLGLVNFSIILGIHFEALCLWLKGIKLTQKPT